MSLIKYKIICLTLILITLGYISCKNNKIKKETINVEYTSQLTSSDSLLRYFPFLKLQDTSTQYYEMRNIIDDDTLDKDYDWNLLTFEKILFAKRDGNEYILIGNLWGSKRAIVIYGINSNENFKKLYSMEINFIDTIKITNINNFYFFEIETFYQTFCEKQVGYNIFVYQNSKFFDVFTTLKSINIINDNPLCSNGESYNTIFRLLEENNSIKLLSKKYYSQNKDTLITIYKFDGVSFTSQ